MNNTPLLGEQVGFHVNLGWPRPDPCWGDCSYCAEGQYRFEDEQTVERLLGLLRFWRNCADAIDIPPRLRRS
jgi:hypothetical protein